jgi:hypothetical protein
MGLVSKNIHWMKGTRMGESCTYCTSLMARRFIASLMIEDVLAIVVGENLGLVLSLPI